MNILVTGAKGFIGRNLIAELVAQGLKTSVLIRNQSVKNLFPETVKEYYYDGSTQSLVDLFKNTHFDLVIHLASHFLATHKSEDIEPLIASNILFGTQLLQAMAEGGVSQLINVGTVWQNYNNESYNPVCLYAATKEAFMAIARYYIELHKFCILNLKLTDTYGKNDTRKKIIYLLKNAADTGEPIELSQGEQFVDLVHIKDICSAFIVAIKRIETLAPGSFEEYRVSSGAPIKLKELVLVFARASKKKIQAQFGLRPYRSRESMVPFEFGSILPGWKIEIDLDTGIKNL